MTMRRKLERERTLTQRDFDRFAELSGDDNPIHVDPGFAAGTRFGRTVAHGLLLNTVLRGLTEELLPGARQLSQSLMFPAPTYAGDPLRFSVEIDCADAETAVASFRVERIADGETTCSGSSELVTGSRAA